MPGSGYETLAHGAPVTGRFDATALLQALLDVESALAQARAAAGRSDSAAAAAITGMCKVGLFDAETVLAAGAQRGNVAAEMADRLRETVALFDPAAAVEVHRDCADADMMLLAGRLLVRRALAVLDERMSQLAGALAAHVDAAADGLAAEAALLHLLAVQRRIRTAGAAALKPPWSRAADPAAGLMGECALRLELSSAAPAAALDEPDGDDHAASAALAVAVAGACVACAPAGEALRRLVEAAADPLQTARLEAATRVVRGAARRAPHRVAAWLECAQGEQACATAAAAELAALLESAIAGVGVLAEVALRLPAAAAGAGAAASADATRRQLATAPWRRWRVR